MLGHRSDGIPLRACRRKAERKEKGERMPEVKPTWQNLGFHDCDPCRRTLEITIVAGAALPSPNKLHLMSQDKSFQSFSMAIDRHCTDTTASISMRLYPRKTRKSRRVKRLQGAKSYSASVQDSFWILNKSMSKAIKRLISQLAFLRRQARWSRAPWRFSGGPANRLTRGQKP